MNQNRAQILDITEMIFITPNIKAKYIDLFIIVYKLDTGNLVNIYPFLYNHRSYVHCYFFPLLVRWPQEYKSIYKAKMSATTFTAHLCLYI